MINGLRSETTERRTSRYFREGRRWYSSTSLFIPYSAEKLERNITRDADTRQQLKSAGWTVIEVWEHEDPMTVADAVAVLVRPRSRS
jgi:G:T-mismatch repair DNA endonuclease (very short patch repair protein)